MSPRFLSFISGVNKGNEEVGGELRFPCVTSGMERFSLDFPRAIKKWRVCFGSGVWVRG